MLIYSRPDRNPRGTFRGPGGPSLGVTLSPTPSARDSCRVDSSTCVASNSTVPTSATGSTPLPCRLNGFGHDPGLMSRKPVTSTQSVVIGSQTKPSGHGSSPPVQSPPEQDSPTVHGLPSSHGPLLLVVTQHPPPQVLSVH